MFRKKYRVIIEAMDAVNAANKLADKRLWFQIGPEYQDYTDPERRWFRTVEVKATKSELAEIFNLDEVVCGVFAN